MVYLFPEEDKQPIMKKILVPVDFEPASEAASHYAAALAVRFDARVHLLHVYQEPLTGAEIPAAWTVTGPELAKQNTKQVNRLVEKLAGKYPIEVDGSIVLGFTSDTIVHMAKEMDVDLVVMGMKRDSNKVFGSTVTATIRKTKVAVLVVPEEFAFVPITEIALASDFDMDVSSSYFPVLFRLIEKFDSNLHILHVEKDADALTADKFAGKMQVEQVFAKTKHSYRTLESADVDDAIIEYVNQHLYNLLVMVAHKHATFQRLINRPHTYSMAFKVKIPMLVRKG